MGKQLTRLRTFAREHGAALNRAGDDASLPSGDPAAYALVLGEAIRALSAQEKAVDELRTRSGVMLSAAGVVSAFLGSAALTAVSNASAKSAASPSTPQDPPMLVLGMYVAILAAVVLTIGSSAVFVMILRTQSWVFQSKTKSLLADYVEADPPASLAELQRSLAWYMSDSEEKNRVTLDRLYGWFNWGAVIFVVELVVWFLILALRLKP